MGLEKVMDGQSRKILGYTHLLLVVVYNSASESRERERERVRERGKKEKKRRKKREKKGKKGEGVSGTQLW